MFASVLFFTFLSAFIAIATLGHVLLLAALWPNLFARANDAAREVELEPAPTAQHIYSVERRSIVAPRCVLPFSARRFLWPRRNFQPRCSGSH